MPLYYAQDTKYFDLHAAINDYLQWYSDVIISMRSNNANKPAAIPRNVLQDDLQNNTNDISALFDDLNVKYDVVLSAQSAPHAPIFIGFQQSFDRFIIALRDLERDFFIESTGLDPLTGLRAQSKAIPDLKIEMDRLARQGNPFSILLTQVDDFNEADINGVKLAVEIITKSMRGFDDAYYMGQGQFLISLKHADMIGAQAAVQRLQRSLSEHNQQQSAVTMSYCMSEPVIDEDLESLLSNMATDLKEHNGQSSSVLAVKDISPLERYIIEMQE